MFQRNKATYSWPAIRQDADWPLCMGEETVAPCEGKQAEIAANSGHNTY